MKRIDLKKVQHEAKIGQFCPEIKPNVIEDSIFYDNGVPIGFFLRQLPERAKKLATIANAELRSKRVPKSVMNRKTTDGYDEEKGRYKYKNEVKQYSTIIGGVPKKAHMKRHWNAISSVHQVPTAKTFIKAMLKLLNECEGIVKEILPDQYERQIEIFKNVDDKWKLGNMFTSSISNFNISAQYHRDTGNIPNTINIIVTKREFSEGGNLHVPDYNATIDQCDNSILVYPAWRNVHGVTPIVPLREGGYRNSLVFYPLNAFVNK